MSNFNAHKILLEHRDRFGPAELGLPVVSEDRRVDRTHLLLLCGRLGAVGVHEVHHICGLASFLEVTAQVRLEYCSDVLARWLVAQHVAH